MAHAAERQEQRRLVQAVSSAIEALRYTRREQWQGGGHPEQKHFTQEELADLAYPAYKHLLQGRTARLPSRTQLLQIATYLECTLQETNDLLFAAQYLPLPLTLRSDEERALIQRATALVQLLPLPAFVTSRGCRYQAVNGFALALTETPALEAVAETQRDAMHWFFDPTLPSYRVHASNPGVWEQNARSALAAYAHASRPFQREAWYQAQLTRWHTLPRFSAFWRDATTRRDAATPPRETITTSAFVPTLIREGVLSVPMDSGGLVSIGIGIPLCAGARFTYQQVGCAITEGGWEQALRDLARC